MWTTARNLWIDWMRGRRRMFPLDHTAEIPDPTSDHADVRVDLLDVAAAIRRLPRTHQRALLLQVLCDGSRDEIAERLGVSAGRVHQLLKLARQKLRAALGRGRSGRGKTPVR